MDVLDNCLACFCCFSASLQLATGLSTPTAFDITLTTSGAVSARVRRRTRCPFTKRTMRCSLANRAAGQDVTSSISSRSIKLQSFLWHFCMCLLYFLCKNVNWCVIRNSTTKGSFNSPVHRFAPDFAFRTILICDLFPVKALKCVFNNLILSSWSAWNILFDSLSKNSQKSFPCTFVNIWFSPFFASDFRQLCVQSKWSGILRDFYLVSSGFFL